MQRSLALQFLEGVVDPFAEGHLIELVQHGIVEALHDPVRLRVPGLGARVVHVCDGEVEFVLMPLGTAA